MNETELTRTNGTGPRLVVGALLVMFAGAAITQAGVQVIRRNDVLKLAREGDRDYTTRVEPARRGEISTRDGKLVAANANDYQVGISYKICPKSRGFFMDLSQVLGLSVADLEDGPARGLNYKSWVCRLTRDQVQEIKRMQKDWQADGLTATSVDSRDYLMGDQYSGLVGVVRNGTPVSGLERGMNEVLAGTPGKLVGFADRSGLFIPSAERPSKEPVNGKTLTLTLDSALQSAAFDAVKEAVVTHKASSGCAVVVDPKTGDILAAASWPAYDPNANLDPSKTFTTSYMGALEPGSTFKILTLAKAIDDGKVGHDWTTTCVGELPTDSRHSVRCDTHHGVSGAHGEVDQVKAIAVSCNTSASKWSLSLGRKVMVDYLGQLGLVGKPGLGLPGEASSRYDRGDTSRMQTANFGFGQAMVCSPIALAGAFSMLGNHGRIVKPRLVKALDGVEKPVSPGTQVVRAETADSVLKTMESVIESDYGTGASLKIPGYRLAGKTGTAQKLNGSKKGGYVSNFVGFVPATNPRACVLVMIDDPQVGYYGSVVAGPVFTDIAKAVLRRSPVEPEGLQAVESKSLVAARRRRSFDDLSAELAKGPAATPVAMMQQTEVPTKFNQGDGITVERESTRATPKVVKAPVTMTATTITSAQKVKPKAAPAKKVAPRAKTTVAKSNARLLDQMQEEAFVEAIRAKPKAKTAGIAAKLKARLRPNTVKGKKTETQVVIAPRKAAPKLKSAPTPANVKPRVVAAKPVVLSPSQKPVAKARAKKQGGSVVVLQSKQRVARTSKVPVRSTGKMGSSVRPTAGKKKTGGTLTG